MKQFTALLACSAILLTACNSEESVKSGVVKHDTVQAEKLKGIQDMNVKAVPASNAPLDEKENAKSEVTPEPKKDFPVNTGVNFGKKEKVGGDTHIVEYDGKLVTVTDTYFARDLWHAVYEDETSPTEGYRKTICTQIIVNRESDVESLNGDIARYNVVCTDSEDKFKDHPSLKELRNPDIEESVIEAFNKWFSFK